MFKKIFITICLISAVTLALLSFKSTPSTNEWENIKHFVPKEFDSPDVSGSGLNMNYAFIQKLDSARTVSEIQYIINSGYRTIQHNKKVGGKSNSAHLKGLAADISALTSNQKFRLVYGLMEAGFTRIGIYDTHIHVDMDKSKSQNLLYKD